MSAVPGWSEEAVQAARAAGVDIEWAAGVGRERVLAAERAALLRERDAAIEANRIGAEALAAALEYREFGYSDGAIAAALQQGYGRDVADRYAEIVEAGAAADALEDATIADFRQAQALADEAQAEREWERAAQAEQAQAAALRQRADAIAADLHRRPYGAELEGEVLAGIRAVDPAVVRANPEAVVEAAYTVAKASLGVAGDALHHAAVSAPFRSTEMQNAWVDGLKGRDVPPTAHELARQRERSLVERAVELNERHAAQEVERRVAPVRSEAAEAAAATEAFTRSRRLWDDAFINKGPRPSGSGREMFADAVERKAAVGDLMAANERAARGVDASAPAGPARSPRQWWQDANERGVA
ncbi:MAG: hypothetical protein ACYDCH_13710 [Gaiellaceae bacterium]